MATSTLTDRIIKVYVDGDLSAIDGLYAPDAVADCNVPHWRYQLHGAEEINRVVREDELGVPDRRVTSWRTGAAHDGLYLETEVRFKGEHGEHMWRSLHLFRLDHDQITQHTLYCSGVWSPSDIARYDVAAAPARA